MAVGLPQPMMTWSGTSVPWPRTEPGPQRWHLSALKKDFSKEVKSSEASNVVIRREDTCRESTGRLREIESCTLSRWIKLLIQGQFCWCRLANHLALTLSLYLVWCRALPSLEKTLMLGKIEDRRRGDRGWDGWMAWLTQWTWVWVNCRR